MSAAERAKLIDHAANLTREAVVTLRIVNAPRNRARQPEVCREIESLVRANLALARRNLAGDTNDE